MATPDEERKVKILVDAQQANASIRDMGAGVALLKNQLEKMAADDPKRTQLKRDFDVLSERVGTARASLRTYVLTEEEARAAAQALNRENQQVILNGQRVTASFNDMDKAAKHLEAQLHELAADDPGRAKMLADYHALQGRIAGVSQEMKGATESTGWLKQGFASAFGFLLGGGIMGVVQQLFGFFSASREEFLSSAKSAADLEATLKATKNAAGLTADEIRKIGAERAKYTLFDDDETNRASAMLLTFKNVKKGIFEDAIPAIQDMATKMAGDGEADLKGASIQLGKALNDPVKGITALTRVGVTFTEQQKEQIAAMVKAGDTAGAQRLILHELNSEFGGSAEAARKAAGGMATLSMGWNEFKETVGSKVNQVLEQLGQWLGRVLDKSQPLVDMVSELVDEFAAYYRELYDIVKSLGLFSEKTDTAAVVVEVLKVALTVLLMPLKLLLALSKAVVDSFIDWYNKSELLRGVLGGLGAYIKTMFLSIKDDALKILGSVGDIIVGIFTLDKEKIKRGLAAALDVTQDLAYRNGLKAAAAFQQGFVSAKDNRIERSTPAAEEEKPADKLGTPAGSEAAGGESEKDRKAREAAEKKAQAARDKATREHMAALQRQVQEEGFFLQHGSELERLRQEAANTDELKRREAQRRKIIDAAEQKYNELVVLEGDHTQQIIELVEGRDLALRELQAKWDEEDKKERQRQLDEKLKAIEQDTADSIAALDNTHALNLVSEQEYQQQLFDIKKRGLDDQLALLVAAGQGETNAAKKIQDGLLKLQTDRVTREKKQEQDLLAFNQKTAQGGAQLLKEGLLLVEDTLDKKSSAYQEFKRIRKAAELAEVGINLVGEIQAIWKAASENPLNGVTSGAAGIAQGTIQTGLAVVRAAAAGIKIAGYAQGGFTGEGLRPTVAAGTGRLWEMLRQATGLSVGSNGRMHDAEGLEVAGIVHKNEYVIPEWLRADPQVIQVENWLEARRVRGYAQGGATSDDRQAAQPGRQSGPAADSQAQLVQVLASLDQRLRQVEDWPTQLEVVLDLLGLDREQEKVKQVKARSGLK